LIESSLGHLVDDLLEAAPDIDDTLLKGLGIFRVANGRERRRISSRYT
jgi:hypothetical protein